MAWQPTTVLRFTRAIPSSACTAVVETDAGTGYLKAMGGPEGPHTLACELIGTQLAAWLGLNTFDFAVIEIEANDEIPFINAKGEQIGKAQPGPAFISRGESGDVWGGEQRQLRQLINPDDISRIVVLDTWTLNCDRYGLPEPDSKKKPRINLRNVFLSEDAPAGKLCLKAIDHTHCFTCGKALTSTRLRSIGTIKNERVFGLFPEFRDFLNRYVVQAAAKKLAEIEKAVVASMMRQIPSQWEVGKEMQEAWTELIVGRARFVVETIESKLWPQKELALGDGD